jgi:hypothetical protein
VIGFPGILRSTTFCRVNELGISANIFDQATNELKAVECFAKPRDFAVLDLDESEKQLVYRTGPALEF